MKKQDLLNALEIVKPGLANREVIEQSTSFAFVDGRVVTYNDEISLSHPVENLEITGAIKAEELYLILKKIKQDEINVELTDNEILLTAGRIKVGLILQTEIKLPLEEVGTIEKWKSLPEGFLDAMELAMYSCSKSGSSTVNSVHVNEDGFIEGSDGFQIMHISLDKKFPTATFLIPASSVSDLLKIKPAKISLGSGWIHFKNESGTVLSCRILEDKYPDTSNFLNVEGVEIAFPRTINEILERASVFKKVEGTTSNEDVTIRLENNRIQVKSNSDTGWFSEEANVVYEGDKLEFTIVPSLLKNILKSVRICSFNGSILKFVGENWEFVTLIKE